MGALGDDFVQPYEDYKLLAHGLSATAVHVKDAKAEAATARTEAAALAAELGQWRGAACTTAAMDGLRRELREVKADKEILEDTVLATATTINGLIGQVGQSAGQRANDVDARLEAHAAAVNGQLDSIRQEMKGGGITVGGVIFSGQEAAMDWARIHLPPNTYQCIGGMNCVMCLILEAVVHQEDVGPGARVSPAPPQGWTSRSVCLSHADTGGSTSGRWVLAVWYPPGHPLVEPLTWEPRGGTPLMCCVNDRVAARPFLGTRWSGVAGKCVKREEGVVMDFGLFPASDLTA